MLHLEWGKSWNVWSIQEDPQTVQIFDPNFAVPNATARNCDLLILGKSETVPGPLFNFLTTSLFIPWPIRAETGGHDRDAQSGPLHHVVLEKEYCVHGIESSHLHHVVSDEEYCVYCIDYFGARNSNLDT